MQINLDNLTLGELAALYNLCVASAESKELKSALGITSDKIRTAMYINAGIDETNSAISHLAKAISSC